MMGAHQAATDWTISSPQEFVGLHNVAKHCIYMQEAFDAMLLTIDDMLTQHARLFEKAQHKETTQSMLKHKRGLFNSVKLRLASLDKRTQNIITLVTSHTLFVFRETDLIFVTNANGIS